MAATYRQSFQVDLKTMAYCHMVAPQKMEDKKIVHIVLHMGLNQCKADKLDGNQINQLDIDLMDQTVQYS